MPIAVNFKPSIKQYQAWQHLTDTKTNFIGYGGAAFGGKSYLLCYWLVAMCIAYPGTGWGLGRKELVNLKRTTLLTLFKVFSECGITEQGYIYNQQLNMITFLNGSQIFLIDMAYKPSDPLYTRFGGYELTGAGVDESAECEYTAIDILFTRLGRRLNDKYKLTKKFLETFNPAKNHVYRRYYKPYKANELQESYAFIPALPKDNPSPEVDLYIEGILENATQTTKERLIYGNFEYDDDPSKIMDYDSIIDLFSNDHVGRDGSGKLIQESKYITADIARLGKDKTVICLWSGLRCKIVKVLPKNLVTDAANIIKELSIKNNIPVSKIVIDEDGVGGGVKDILRCKGVVNNSAPIKEAGSKLNFDNLKSQLYYHLSKKVNNAEMYVECDPDVKEQLIEELEVIKKKNIDQDGKWGIESKDKQKELLGRSPDYADALMLRMYFELAIGRIIATAIR